MPYVLYIGSTATSISARVVDSTERAWSRSSKVQGSLFALSEIESPDSLPLVDLALCTSSWGMRMVQSYIAQSHWAHLSQEHRITLKCDTYKLLEVCPIDDGCEDTAAPLAAKPCTPTYIKPFVQLYSQYSWVGEPQPAWRRRTLLWWYGSLVEYADTVFIFKSR